MSSIELVSEHGCYGGVQRFYKHCLARNARSHEVLGVSAAAGAQRRKVPVLYYLSGLTCTEETFPIKAHAQQAAAELGLMLVAPDTSPREPRLPGDADSWDFGYSAGFYVDATQAPWSKNYRMYSYVTRELPELVAANLPAPAGAPGIFGHSMGGHGALTCALRNPRCTNRFRHSRRSRRRCSAPGGKKAFTQLSRRGRARRGASMTPANWSRASPFPDRF